MEDEEIKTLSYSLYFGENQFPIVVRRMAGGGRPVPVHDHEFSELVIVTKGWVEHEIGVVTERTAHVASPGENGAGRLSREIEHRQLLKAVYFHVVSSGSADSVTGAVLSGSCGSVVSGGLSVSYSDSAAEEPSSVAGSGGIEDISSVT